MVGKGLLMECLENPNIESVLTINRQPGNIKNNKLKEILHSDFYNFSTLTEEFKGYNACFFCLGVSAAGLSEQEYHKITYGLTVNFAETLLKINPELTFCYVSGAGTDSTEKGRMMWARVKGKTENALLAMPFKASYMFRPGFIQPLKGIKSKTQIYNVIYILFKPLYFALKPFKGFVTNTESLGKAMINVALNGFHKKIIESKDINKLA